jgi:hypothetical protein
MTEFVAFGNLLFDRMNDTKSGYTFNIRKKANKFIFPAMYLQRIVRVGMTKNIWIHL